MKTTASLLLLFFRSCLPCKGQMYYEDNPRLFKGLLTVGLNGSQIDGDGPAGYHSWGFTGGIGTAVQWHKNISTSLELLYSQRGSIQKGEMKNGAVERFKINTDYIEMPVCFNVNDNKALTAGIGISPAVLINYRITYQLTDASTGAVSITPSPCLAIPMKEYDVSGLIKMQFKCFRSLSIGAKYQYSLISLRPPCEGDTRANGQYYNVITFYLQYKI